MIYLPLMISTNAATHWTVSLFLFLSILATCVQKFPEQYDEDIKALFLEMESNNMHM